MTLAQLIPVVIQVSIFLTVFGIGLGATLTDATSLFRRPSLLVRSIVSLNVVMALFAVAVARHFDLDPSVEIALVALAASPVPPLLPRKEKAGGGSDAYAVGLVVAAVLLAFLTVPAAVELIARYFGVEASIAPRQIAGVVFISAIAPLAAGILVRRFWPLLADRIAKPVSIVATVLLLLAMLPVLFRMSGAIWALVGDGMLIVLIVFAVLGLAVGHLLGGPDPDERTVLALATATRHPGIALTIASLNFPGQRTQILAVILCHLIIGGILSVPYNMWRRRVHAASRPAR